MRHRLLRRPSPAMVVALLALFVAFDGPATAARLIDGKTIKRNSIRSQQIRNGTIAVADLSRKARAALQVTPENSVGGRQLQAKSVGPEKLADGAVGTAALADRGVGAADLADGAVGSGQLAAASVTASKVADGAIGSDAVADGSLRTNDLGDFAGAVQVNFTSVPGRTCQSNKSDDPIVPQPTVPNSTSMIADDVIVVTPPVGWPDQLFVSGNPGAGNTLRIIVCNPTDDTISVPQGVRPVFRYLAIDQP